MARSLAQHQVHRKVFHIGAAALRDAHQALAAQAGERAADGVPVHAELLGQRGGNARPEAVARSAQCWCLRDLKRGRERGGAGCHETYMRTL